MPNSEHRWLKVEMGVPEDLDMMPNFMLEDYIKECLRRYVVQDVPINVDCVEGEYDD